MAHFFPAEAEQFRRTAAEIAESALWAGIHFRSDIVAGTAIGRGVAQLLLDSTKQDA
jgi:membrane-associated phospholipid phosphatase